MKFISMEFVISDKNSFDTFTNVFQHLKEFNDSFNLQFSSTGLFIQGFDKCRVSIFELQLNEKWFDNYKYNADAGQIEVGFNAKIFHKILTTRQDNQDMIMKCNSEEHYTIDFKGGGKKMYEKTFKIPLIYVDAEQFTIPYVEETVEFKILQSNFASIIDQLILFGENVNIQINNDNVIFYSNGLEGEMNAKISTDDLEEFSAEECSEDELLIDQDYSLKLLKNLCLFSKLGDFMNVSASNNKPICISYDLVKEQTMDLAEQMDNLSITEKATYLRLYLAPKIE